MNPTDKQVFLSYSGEDAFVAELLQLTVESMLRDYDVTVWSYRRDQSTSQRHVGESIRDRVKESVATIFLLSPSTLASGATQWMELGYSHAYDIRTFVILHELSYSDLERKEKGVPPLLVEGQCNPSSEWKRVVEELRLYVEENSRL